MIWGLAIEPGQMYSCTLNEEVHLSLAALETRPAMNEPGNKYSQLVLKTKDAEQLLCTLVHGSIFQQSLDLKLMPREKVSFTVQGSGVVYITGYSLSSPEYSEEGGQTEHIPESSPVDESASTVGATHEVEITPLVLDASQEDIADTTHTVAMLDNEEPGYPASSGDSQWSQPSTSSAYSRNLGGPHQEYSHSSRGQTKQSNTSTRKAGSSKRRSRNHDADMEDHRNQSQTPKHPRQNLGETYAGHQSEAVMSTSTSQDEETVEEYSNGPVCVACGQTFNSVDDLNAHPCVTGKVACKHCGKMIAKEGMRRHVRVHTGEKPYQCKGCSERFNDYSNMRRHIRRKHKEQFIKKEPCVDEDGLSPPGTKRKHKKMKKTSLHNSSGNFKDPLKVPYCMDRKVQDPKVPSGVGQRGHERNQVRKNCCKFCRAPFATIQLQYAHEDTHTERRAYRCQFCAGRFQTKAHRIQHERIHLGVRPFICRFCSKSFTQSCNRNRHEATVHGKKHKCKYCSLTFNDRKRRALHARATHLMENGGRG